MNYLGVVELPLLLLASDFMSFFAPFSPAILTDITCTLSLSG
jgi:hypothetical protein